MGNMCTGNPSPKPNKEEEVSLPKYSSRYEKTFESFDKEYNLLSRLPLYEYQLSLINLPYSSQMRGPSSVFLDETDDDNCSVFFNNFIANHPIFYLKKDENVNQIFVEFINQLLLFIKKGTKSFMKKREKEFNSKVVKKYYLCIIGILFCYSTPKGKIDAFFSLLANDNGIVERNINTELLLYSIVFLAGLAHYLTLKEMKKRNTNLTFAIDDEAITQAFTLEKIDSVFNSFINGFFNSNQKEISYAVYLSLIQKVEFAWVLTPQGIRSQF